MNQKQLTILIVLGLLIGGLGIAVSKRRSASWSRGEGGGEKVLANFPINDVTRVQIKQTAGELNLVKEDVWKIKERWGYPANFSEIADFLRKSADLKSVQPVKVGPSNLGRLELLSPDKPDTANAGTLVDFKGKDDKSIKSLLLGKKYMRDSGDPQMGGGGFPAGRYVMMPGNVQSVSIVSEAFTEIETKPENWLDKEWFKVEKLKSISVVSTNATNNWKVARETETGAWSLADQKEGEPVETNKLSSVGYALSSPSFNDVLSPETKLEPSATATLETFDNFTYTVRVAGRTNDENYSLSVAVAGNFAKERTPGADEKPEDKEKLDKTFKENLQKLEDKLKKEKSYEKWTYLVAKYAIDPLLKERKEFLIEKKEEPPKPLGDAPAGGAIKVDDLITPTLPLKP